MFEVFFRFFVFIVFFHSFHFFFFDFFFKFFFCVFFCVCFFFKFFFFFVFSDSVLCLGKIHENHQSNDAWEERLGWFKSSPVYRNFDRIDKKCLCLARIGRLDILCQWTILHDRLRNGPKPVTNAWIDWFLTFITHVKINSIVMWGILLSNADWDCFRTPILREILRIQNPLLEDIVRFWKSYICSNKLDV